MPHAPRLLSVRHVAFAVLLVGTAYGWWVNLQYERLNAVNQLELQDASAELNRALENAKETVNRFEPSDAALKHQEAPACVFDAQQPYISFEDADCREESGTYRRARLATAPRLAIEAERVPPREMVQGKSAPGGTARWRFELDTLVRELAFSDAFALVLVADESGKVLYQTTPRQQQWRRLLRWGERTFEDSGARNTGGLRIQNLTDLLGKDAVPGWSRLQAASGRTTVRVGGDWHQLYVQPVAGGTDAGVRLVLGAIVPADRLFRRALAIDTYFVALLVALFLLGALGLPFLKLLAMSAHERFRVRDVYQLYVSCAALLALATFIVLGLDTYRRWSSVADEGLAQMADDLEARLTREVLDIRRALIDYDYAVSARYPPPCMSPQVLPHWFDAAAPDPHGMSLRRKPGVFIDQVTWIDPGGQQIWKVTSDQIGVNRNVAQRPYFTAVRGGHLYRDAWKAPDVIWALQSWPFFVAPDRSITDGRFYTFLSIPSQLDDYCSAVRRRSDSTDEVSFDRGYVAVASTRLLSLEHAALPVGYGFAVVTRDGRVLYHSDARRSLRENLFDHLDQGDRARAIAQAGRKEPLSASYREVAHRLQFNPLRWSLAGDMAGEPEEPGTPSSGLLLVAFRDVSTERAIVARAFVVSLLPMLGLVVLIGAALGLVGLVARRHQGSWARWLWPHGGLTPMYKVMAASVAAVILVAWVMVADTRLWPLLVLPACAVAPGLAVYGRGAWHVAPRRALAGYGWYTTELTLLALGLIILPTSALFNLTIGHEFGVLIQSERERMTAQATDARLALRAEARAQAFPEEIGDEVAAAHAVRQSPVAGPSAGPLKPAPFDKDPGEIGAGDRRVIQMHEWLDSLVPADSTLLGRLRYRDIDERYVPPGSLGALTPWGAAGIVAIVVVLAVWVRWSAIHLHAADLTPAAPVSNDDLEAVWDRLPPDHKHVLLQATHEHIANPRQRPVVRALAEQGLIRLAPDLQPATPALAQLLDRMRSSPEHAATLHTWERTHQGHSWQQVRPVLVASLVVVAVFLVGTQPALQSEVVGIATGVTALGASAVKLRDLVAGWIGSKTGAPQA